MSSGGGRGGVGLPKHGRMGANPDAQRHADPADSGRPGHHGPVPAANRSRTRWNRERLHSCRSPLDRHPDGALRARRVRAVCQPACQLPGGRADSSLRRRSDHRGPTGAASHIDGGFIDRRSTRIVQHARHRSTAHSRGGGAGLQPAGTGRLPGPTGRRGVANPVGLGRRRLAPGGRSRGPHRGATRRGDSRVRRQSFRLERRHRPAGPAGVQELRDQHLGRPAARHPGLRGRLRRPARQHDGEQPVHGGQCADPLGWAVGRRQLSQRAVAARPRGGDQRRPL